MKPDISDHFLDRKPSSIRSAQISFQDRSDKNSVVAINLAIGNVSLPMHPAMVKRLKNLSVSPFSDGILRYTSSSGSDETVRAFLNIISYEGVDTSNPIQFLKDTWAFINWCENIDSKINRKIN